jgi:hypothetical protein
VLAVAVLSLRDSHYIHRGVPMPTLTLLSLYNARKGMYAAHLTRARNELERFKADLVVRFGEQEASAVQQQVSWTEDMIFGRTEVLPLTDEGYAAVKTLRELTRKVATVLKDIRTPDCWFRESPVPISVLETVSCRGRRSRRSTSRTGGCPSPACYGSCTSSARSNRSCRATSRRMSGQVPAVLPAIFRMSGGRCVSRGENGGQFRGELGATFRTGASR